MGRPVVHWELWSKDPQKVADFYAKAFDWNISHLAEMKYWLVDTGGEGGINGGIFKPQEGKWPGNMAFYINVDELEPFRKKIRDAGGKILIEHQEVPNVGEFCLFSDPDGRALGIWKQTGEQAG